MSLILSLDAEVRDRLVWVVESSLQVRDQSAFFLWGQGALQSLVPHEILICAVHGGAVSGWKMCWLASTRYFREEHFQAACARHDGLVARMMSGWRANGVPQFLAPEDADDQTARDLLASELKDLAAHGVRDGAGEMVGYFGFARTGLRVSAQSVRILEVIVPHLYATYCRILGEEALHAGAIPRADSAVTQRETEILNWIKEGKTTTDIAGILRLSPFTVKNHVQNILKKLGARSRSHAVAQAMALGILQN